MYYQNYTNTLFINYNACNLDIFTQHITSTITFLLDEPEPEGIH